LADCGFWGQTQEHCLVNRDKVQVLLSQAEQYISEATAIIQRQEHHVHELRRRPDDTNAAEALIECFQAAEHAMARHRHSMEQQLGRLG
jgi:hypothetical protein